MSHFGITNPLNDQSLLLHGPKIAILTGFTTHQHINTIRSVTQYGDYGFTTSKFITRVREKSHLVLEKGNYLLDNYSSKFICHSDKITSGSTDN